MRAFANCLLVIILLSVSCNVYSQPIVIDESNNITKMPGDELFAEWSYDGNNLLFESIYNDISSLCIYRLADDTVLQLSNQNYNFKNPVWHPDGDKIVFDSDKEGSDYLYILDMTTLEVKPLFRRRIVCRNATFSTSSRLVYFTGFDELMDCWEIYSYDFISDNLNKLTDYKVGTSCPDIYSDGKQIVYCKVDTSSGNSRMEVINWYGEPSIQFNKFNAYYPSWGSSGLKLFFISKMDNKEGELYSIWKDGSHLERLTHDTIRVTHPVVSPDGTSIAISVRVEKGWDIFIFNFKEY